MMEKLLELDRKSHRRITVSFYLSQMIIAIPDNNDNFEANIWTSMLNENYIKKEFSTLLSLFQIVNDLNLNLRI